MDDTELIDFASKASGFAYSGAANPLIDDALALRLAVKLYIGVRPHGPDHWQQPNVAVALWDFGDKSGRVTVEHGDDPQCAARRAIVRAAAEVGKAMP